MKWLKKLMGGSQPAPSPSSLPAALVDREARQQAAGTEINRLVQEFLDQRGRRNRPGPLSVQNVETTVRYHDSGSKRAFASIVGKRGWVYKGPGCIVLVSTDGDWYVVGKIQYRWPEGNGYRRDTETYSSYGGPGRLWFEGLAVQEAEALSDGYYANPEGLVKAVEEAIAFWNAPRQPKPGQGRPRQGGSGR